MRDDGGTFQAFLYRHALPVPSPTVAAYPEDHTAEIERIARRDVADWYDRYRSAITERLGHLPKRWISLNAQQLIDPETLDCPAEFEVRRDDLAAAMVLLALIDDKGPNLSTIQSYTSASVERASEDAAFVTGVKARNRQILRTPAPAGGLFSYGGLLEFVTAATVVERHFRNSGSGFDTLLFVATGDDHVLTSDEVHREWWRSAVHGWDCQSTPPQRILFPRLRKSALLRARDKGYGEVVGQTRKTARLYLADAVPEVILIPGILSTIQSMADTWRINPASLAALNNSDHDKSTSPAQLEAMQRLSGADQIMDVGVAACTSNGQAPNDETRPCRLGPAACFVCPNGIRTPEIIPGLIAAVRFTENIRKWEPDEWLKGPASTIGSLAQKALDQFPPPLVDAVPAEAIANSMALIACVYLEGSTRD
ncbi:MAG: hypothetical protein ABWX92_08465 [Mycetocola sp.]